MLQNHPKLNKALKKFANEYCCNPFKCLYEADVQVLLSRHLEVEFKEPYDILRKQNRYESLESIPSMNFGKSHREYPAGILFYNVVLGAPLQLGDDSRATNHYSENWYHILWIWPPDR